MDDEHREWERMKERDRDRKGKKRSEELGSKEQEKGRRKRRRKYSMIEEHWGAETPTTGEENRDVEEAVAGEQDTITSFSVEEAEGEVKRPEHR